MDNPLNNTILVPYHDSLVESNPLPEYDAAGKISEINNTKPTLDNGYAAYIKLNDENSVRIIGLQEITGFGMTRDCEQRPGSSPDYVVNLPGLISYSDIKIKHIYTRDKFFLDWLTNGTTKGGAVRADIEIHVKPLTKSEMVFTLHDAFPVQWNITNLDAANNQTAIMETVVLTYSSVQFSVIEQ